ncbi:unnamed protein product [Echinostoma caproni]|uniref:Uncharacterized protein n=1 Tax=Echinostoma caproni TaxID=27848 RepID=A0A183AVU5_9TREM|nr:unnamed protein product [Echinostoma caproni]
MVRNHLESLNMNKSAGTDGIHPAIVKPLAGILPQPMCQLFKRRVQTENETVGEYTATVRALVHKAFGSRSLELRKALAKKRLQDGLRIETARQELAANPAASLLKAVNRAWKFDTSRTTEGAIRPRTSDPKIINPPVAGVFDPMATVPLSRV